MKKLCIIIFLFLTFIMTSNSSSSDNARSPCHGKALKKCSDKCNGLEKVAICVRGDKKLLNGDCVCK